MGTWDGVDPARAVAPAGGPGRRVAALVYAVVLVSSSLQVGIAPVLPSYARRFHLSGTGTGLLLSMTALATFCVALPAGRLTDRLGARRLTLLAGWLMAVAACTQGLAPSYGALLASRLGFGFGYGIVWTAGLAWLDEVAAGPRALGGAVAASGVGGVAGPALAGWLAARWGLATPFVVTGVALASVTLALTATPSSRPAVRRAAVRTGAQVAALLGRPGTVAAVAAVVAAGVAASVSSLLVPLELHRARISTGGIGLVFALSGVVFVAASAAVSTAGRRVVRARTAFVAMGVLVAILTTATASTAVAAVVATLCAVTASRAVLWSVAYPLAAAESRRVDAGAGVGVATGLLNLVWAATAVASPIAAGALFGHVGARAAFGAAQLATAAVLGVALAGAAALRARSRSTGLRAPDMLRAQ